MRFHGATLGLSKGGAACLALLAIGLLLARPAQAQTSQMRDFDGATAWINSNPLQASNLRGKVVLLDFWEYSCVNCLRTLPNLQSWYARYQQDGFHRMLEIAADHGGAFLCDGVGLGKTFVGLMLIERLVRAFVNISLGRMRFLVGPLAWLSNAPLLVRLPLAPSLGATIGGVAALATAATATPAVPASPESASSANAEKVARLACAPLHSTASR